jgi:hypothetical protein
MFSKENTYNPKKAYQNELGNKHTSLPHGNGERLCCVETFDKKAV